MVELTLIEDASPHYDALDALTARNKDDFIVPEPYYDGPADVPPADRPVPDGFLDNYRNDDEQVVLAHEDGTLVGYMAFGTDYAREDFPLDEPCVYISLTIIDRDHRGAGIGTALNEFLLSEVLPGRLDAEEFILRKTWSTNEPQLRCYEKAGFWPYAREEDHRGPGIDSIWFVRTTESIRGR